MKLFQRKIENFKCDNCGYEVLGNGYTDHCPKCLYSKHVDINPGDRQSKCGGLMKPIGFEIKHGKYIINYGCLKCGYIHKVKTDKNDNMDVLIKIIENK
jgi:uncharacterized Zn finger protein